MIVGMRSVFFVYTYCIVCQRALTEDTVISDIIILLICVCGGVFNQARL